MISPLQRSILEIARVCLESGSHLPTDNAIAADLRRARMSVANALFQLRHKGLIETNGRQVLMVVDVPPPPPALVPVAPVESPQHEVQVKLMALIKHCQANKRKFPGRQNLLIALGISRSSLDHHLRALCERGSIQRLGPGDFRVVTR